MVVVVAAAAAAATWSTRSTGAPMPIIFMRR